MPLTERRPRVCAVSYLNTVPLVWGALNGPQRGELDLTFAVPSICAARVDEGVADVGILPVIEAARLGMETIPGIGIACTGPVRSIFLISKIPFDQVQTLAADTGSRTSVQLSRIVLSRKFGADPRVFAAPPNLNDMLRSADAALLIGDAALAIETKGLTYNCLDLGQEWFELTGLPLVTALWSGRPGALTPRLVELLHGSCQFGLANLDRIASEESGQRGFTHKLVDSYLRENVEFELTERHTEGLQTFLEYARQLTNPVLTEASVLK
ncbi:MAG TPA: menaquinone biosynthesis protein [Bryobacteraceae bacterium]|nr:menaquinone biosynthesis protein [Bryobacteraceae bacterium]HPT26796.1 menaquinone biosynthesis protein [Bryobacteraceae bacterium]